MEPSVLPVDFHSRPTDTPPPQQRPLRCLLVTLIALVILLGVAVLVLRFVLRPAPLEYSVESAHVHGFNITDNALNATFDLALRAYKENRRVGIYYDSVDVTVWYAGQTVAVADAAPFYQRRRNETRLDVTAEAHAMPLTGTAASGLKRDRSAGRTELEVRVRARIRFRVGLIKSKHYELKANCSPVVVHFSSSAAFNPVECDVDI